MTDPVATHAGTDRPELAHPSPPPLAAARSATGWRRLGGYIGPAISVGVLIGAVWQIRVANWQELIRYIPRSPVILLVLAINYLSGPIGDWVIFRKLWKIPADGIFPLVKKMIGNQLLLSYVGEVYFYDWARRHVRMEGSPFGAVKDVAILSAIAGYAMTLVMLVVAWPYVTHLGFGINGKELAGSIAVMLATGLLITVLRNRLLSLPRADLTFVFGVHMVRLMINTVLTGVSWALMMPAVPLSSWLILSTGRLLITRLPLIPNQEMAFAGALVILGGQVDQTHDMIAVIALFITAVHIVLFVAMLLLDLAQRERNA